jgi:hypothetical protein
MSWPPRLGAIDLSDRTSAKEDFGMAREYKLIDSVAYPPSMKLPSDPLLTKVFGDTKF